MEDHPLLTFNPVLAHIAAVPAVLLGCYTALNTWRAVRALHQHPSPVTDQPSATPAPVIPSPWRGGGWNVRRIKGALLGVLLGSTVFCIEMFIVFGLPRITSQTVFDAIWCVILTVTLAFTFLPALDRVWPVPKTVQWSRRSPTAPLRLTVTPHGDKTANGKKARLLLCGTVALSIAALTLTYVGITAHHPFVAAALVHQFSALFRMPRLSIKKFVIWVSAYFITAPFLSIGLGLVIQHIMGKLDDSTSEGEHSKSKTTMASDWLLSLMLVYGQVFAVLVPSVLTAMTLRFEYATTTSDPPRPLNAAPGAPILVPTDHQYLAFRQPIFLASLASLSLGLIAMDAIGYLVPQMAWLPITPIASYITLPVVMAGTALAAKMDGKLSEWWNHAEIWVPVSDDSRQAEEGAAGVKPAEEERLIGGEDKEIA